MQEKLSTDIAQMNETAVKQECSKGDFPYWYESNTQ